MRIILILAALLSALSAVATARAEGLHFISVAWIPSEKQQQYDSFSQAVTPIWARHGMKALLRAKVVGALAGGDEGDNEIDLPSEIAILSVASRASFENYIADPDYRAIRPQRLDAVRQMIVLEGTPKPGEGNPLFDTAPQFAMTFTAIPEAPGAATEAPAPAFTMRVDLAGSIKGEVPDPFNTRPQISLFALSYDDNPMSFVGQNSSDTPVFILQRHAD